MSTNAKTGFNLSRSEIVKWIITIILCGLIAMIPAGDVLTPQMKWFFFVTLFCILLMAFSLLPVIVPAIMMPLGYWMFGVAKPAVIYGAWSNQITWVVLGGLLFAIMMGKSGLSKRIAYKCMLWAHGNLMLVMLFMLVAGLIITPFVPAAVARCAIFGSILIGLCQALDYKPNSPKAVFLFTAGYLASVNPGHMYLTGSNTNLILTGFIENYGTQVDFQRFLFGNFVPCVLWLITAIFIAAFVNRDKNGKKEDRAAIKTHIEKEYQALGKITGQEIRMIVLMIFVMLMLLTSNYHSVNAGMVFCIAVAVGFLPGMNLINQDDVKKVNFTMVFLVTACVAIGDVATELGAGDLIMSYLMPFAPHNIVLLIGFLWLVCFCGNLVMTPVAIISSLAVPILSLAEQLSYNPEAIAYMFNFCTSAIILPYEIAASLVLFGYGMMTTKQFMKNFFIQAVWVLLCIVIFFVPWLKIIGLL
ncbi:MAG: SLC13 family permease [Peptococcaceae bacterium]|nr:SLC13 family permease [Peptococcaceae bacterium]